MRGQRRQGRAPRALCGCALLITALLLGLAGRASAAPSGQITEFSAGITAGSSPSGIAAGPDGNLWFTESDGNRIGRITPAGTSPSSPPAHRRQPPVGIAAGPDGNLWFTECSADRDRPDHPGRARSPSSAPASPPAAARTASRPGPTATSGSPSADGNQIGRITPAGRRSPSSPPASPPAAGPIGITAGPDGNLWFTEYGADRIGRITPAGVDHRVQRRAHRRQPARRDHGRPRRQPLVHRVRRQPASAGSPRPASITEFSAGLDRRQPAPSGSRPAPTATSGSPRPAPTRIGRITPAGVDHRVQRRHHRRQPPRRDRGRARRQPLVHRPGAPRRSSGGRRSASGLARPAQRHRLGRAGDPAGLPGRSLGDLGGAAAEPERSDLRPPVSSGASTAPRSPARPTRPTPRSPATSVTCSRAPWRSPTPC